MKTMTISPLNVQVQVERNIDLLMSELSQTVSWGNRQIAAKKLGFMRDSEALPVLTGALLTDPFWMVRASIIQALEMIGDPAAIPALEDAARTDRFQVVRSYAKKAIERLSK
jgi:HEAT repeat protein